MSHLSAAVRRILVEAGVPEPQAGASAVRKTSRSSKKAADNSISPLAEIDASSTIADGSSVGFGFLPHSTVVKSNAQNDGKVTKILGSALSESAVGNQTTIKDSMVTKSIVTESQVIDSCELNTAVLEKVKISDYSKISNSTFRGKIGTNLNVMRTKATNETKVTAEDGGTINNSVLENAGISFFGKGPIITSSTISYSYVSLGDQGSISLAVVQDKSQVEGAAIIKGIAGKPPVFISNAVIGYEARVLATAKGSPQITGYAEKRAHVLGSAKVYDNAHVAGWVDQDAEVFGDAKVMSNASIYGDCKVGGTAVMVSGDFTKGVYMAGRHEGGDDGASMTGRISSGIRSMLGGED